MFDNIDIKSYRGLKNIRLDDLAMINVIIGENNSGKTSVLEAIQLLQSGDIITRLSNVALKRQVIGRMPIRNTLTKYDMIYYSLPVHEIEGTIRIKAHSLQEEYETIVNARIENVDKEFLEFQRNDEQYIPYYEDEDGTIPILVGDSYYFVNGYKESYERFEFPAIGRLKDRDEYDMRFPRHRSRIMVSTRYISPRDVYSGTYEVAYYKGLRKGEKRELIELLRLFDSSIVNVEASLDGRNKRIMIEDETGAIKPLSVYGEGMRRAFSIANALRSIGEGILLIDEFEVGIHKNALAKFVDYLCDLAERNSTQLFLTTHSGDAIDALIDAHEHGNGFNVYRLETYEHNKYSRKYDGSELYRMKREQGYGLL